MYFAVYIHQWGVANFCYEDILDIRNAKLHTLHRENIGRGKPLPHKHQRFTPN